MSCSLRAAAGPTLLFAAAFASSANAHMARAQNDLNPLYSSAAPVQARVGGRDAVIPAQ